MSYVYLAAAAYFGRDNVGLPGFAAHFKHASDEEREVRGIRIMKLMGACVFVYCLVSVCY